MSQQIVVSVSGGKDSTAVVLLTLALDLTNVRYVFADTGNESPWTYGYIDYLEDKLGIDIETVQWDYRPHFERRFTAKGKPWPDVDDNPFLALAVLKSRFPSVRARFCTEYLKVIPIQEQVFKPLADAGIHILSWQGVRAEESPARAARQPYQEHSPSLAVEYPIFRWTAEDVFEAHRYMGVKPNPLYTMGMHRVGCMPCIMCNKEELREIGRRFPEEIERIERWEKTVAKHKPNGIAVATFFSNRGMPTEAINFDDHGIYAKVRWANTKWGGKEEDPEASVFEACHSIYNLCE